MVTAYYITKLSKNTRKVEIEEYYRNLFKSCKKSKEQCRVCLQEGNIPLFGNELSNTLVEALNSFADIKVQEDDEFPKYLCEICHKFLKGAILFRKTAKQSEELLKLPKEEQCADNTLPESQDNENSDNESKPIPKWDTLEVKNEKKYKPKLAPKITCPVCNKVVNRSYFKEHMTMHDPNHKTYLCEICGKYFRLRCAYHNHSLRHRTDFPYRCQFCPYRGRYPELLKNHMRTHTGDYRYMCTECPARFLFKSNLNSHMLKHRDPQFKCDACKRAFHSKLARQRHFEADHLGIKNHVCSTCGKAFGYRNAMMKHQRHVHKREKLLFCRIPSYLAAERIQQGNVQNLSS